MNSGADEQRRGAMAQVVQAHLRQLGALEKILEVLRQPGVRDRQAARRDEHQVFFGRNASGGALAQLRNVVRV